MIGQVIGNYRIISELGKGGMGMVYRAEHVQLGRPAALKMLLPQLSSDPSIVQRFFNEARAASAIDHPGIVEVYDFGTHTDGAAFIVMALLRGESLEARVRSGPLPALEGASIVAQVCGALAAAHAAGIIHRDLKPDNIFLTPNELMPNGIAVKLLDFGIAKLADDKSGAGFKTQTGMMMGTPAYMSPEQCMGRADLDHRTDLYALGCILFHVLTGRPPFLGDQGTGMMIAAHIRDAAPHPRSINPSIPDALAAVVLRLLEKEPAARYQSALEVRQALVAAGASAPSRPPVASPGAGGAGTDVYGATMAPSPANYPGPPTTASGSAGQQQAPLSVAPAAPGSKTGVVLGVAVVAAALLGVGVWAAMRKDSSTTAVTAPSVAPAPVVAAGRPREPAKPDVAPAPVATGSAAAEAPCPLGQVRGFDTQGHCCWPEQAYSTAKQKCVGKPSCPAGHTTLLETCVAELVDAAKPARPASPPHPDSGPTSQPGQPGTPSPSPTFTLDAKTYGQGDPITVTFAAPVPSSNANRAWITVVEASKAPAEFGAWSYLADGARTVKLTAPEAVGAYEVRVHTDYPAKSHHVRHTVPITVSRANAKPPSGTPDADQRFMLASKVARAGDTIEVTFPVAMKAPAGERFWITIVNPSAGEGEFGTYEYVPDGARKLQFELPKEPGDYELRLHANYPRLTRNLVHRSPIRVED